VTTGIFTHFPVITTSVETSAKHAAPSSHLLFAMVLLLKFRVHYNHTDQVTVSFNAKFLTTNRRYGQ